MSNNPIDSESKFARRTRLTMRLQALRERSILVESELRKLTNRHFRVCIFGSARIKPEDKIYETTRFLGQLLGQHSIDVLTGGGPGLMEAANRGVLEGKKTAGTKSRSYGITIELNKFEEEQSEHLDIKHHHKRFSSRLDDFMRLSNAIIVVPGGIGTLLELYFTWQLLQVGHMDDRPIVLLGKDFWQGLLDWMQEFQVDKNNLISQKDFDWLKVVDTPEEVMEIILEEHKKFEKARAALVAPSE